ncbi:Putative transcriptional regulator (fragment) [Thiomonas sp. X19]
MIAVRIGPDLRMAVVGTPDHFARHPAPHTPQGQWVFNRSTPMLRAALTGAGGLAYLPEDLALDHLAAARLQRVLEGWCPAFAGYHLYDASRRQSSRALGVIVEALRFRD